MAVEGEGGSGGGDGASGGGYGARAGKHTDAQMGARPRRRLFDRAAKEDFLGWYAASGNCAWAAGKAGFDDATVWKHRAADPDFADAFDRAAEQGIARARVFMLEEKMRRRPYDFDAAREVPEFEVDRDVAMQLIREHDRAEGAGPGRRGKQGRRPRVASNAEVEEALVKRLAAFGRRRSFETGLRRGSVPPQDERVLRDSGSPGPHESTTFMGTPSGSPLPQDEREKGGEDL